jgi:hypothetical protein
VQGLRAGILASCDVAEFRTAKRYWVLPGYTQNSTETSVEADSFWP